MCSVEMIFNMYNFIRTRYIVALDPEAPNKNTAQYCTSDRDQTTQHDTSEKNF
jgi:hypothetical protein